VLSGIADVDGRGQRPLDRHGVEIHERDVDLGAEHLLDRLLGGVPQRDDGFPEPFASPLVALHRSAELLGGDHAAGHQQVPEPAALLERDQVTVELFAGQGLLLDEDVAYRSGTLELLLAA
jgi:hypothetical protein